MSKEPRVGIVYRVQPEPPDQDHTRWIEAGVIRLGLESRAIDPESLRRAYAGDAESLAEIEANQPEGGFSDAGLSIHVVATEDGHEYLRFDAFEDDPHYHYVRPSGDHNHWVPFDSIAGGDPIEFSLDCLRSRLGPMLCEAGGEHIADRLVASEQARAIDELERQIAALRASGSVPVSASTPAMAE